MFQDHPMLDPDALAKAIDITVGQGRSDIDAGRSILKTAENLLRKQESFLVETTLSGHTYLRFVERARTVGYRIRLVYVGTGSVEINMERIRARVLKGGHDIPEADQRRRFPRSLANLPAALQLAHEVILYDNSSPEGPRRVALKDSGELTFYPPVPDWAKPLQP
jgi:predicted ABC-type ATPase